jgi:hypothetical protein
MILRACSVLSWKIRNRGTETYTRLAYPVLIALEKFGIEAKLP